MASFVSLPSNSGASSRIAPLRSSHPAVDVDGFFDVVSQALQLHIQSEQTPGGTAPFFVRAFPKERLSKVDQPFDGFTFRVLSSIMAPTDNAGTRTPRKPMSLDIQPDPKASGYNVVNQMWFELATVEFTAWSKSITTASSLVTWFHKFMMRYANVLKYFEAYGADKLQFVGRGEDDFETHEQQEVYLGTLTYQIRIQFIDNFSQRRLDSLTVNSQIDTDVISTLLPSS